MLSISDGVEGKEIEVASHDCRWDVPELINVVQVPFLGQRFGESFEERTDFEVGEGGGRGVEELQKANHFSGLIAVVHQLVLVGNVRVPDPVGRGGEFDSDSRVSRGVIPLVFADVLAECSRSKKVGEVVFVADLLEQSHHVVPGNLEDLLVGVRVFACNQVA